MSLTIRALFAACLLGATFNHGLAIWQHGLLWNYGLSNVVLASKIYWDLLTILDPLAALLLFARPRLGIWLTVAIIVSDVLHNTYYVAMNGMWNSPFYLAQVGFLVVVSGLGPLVMRASPSNRFDRGMKCVGGND